MLPIIIAYALQYCRTIEATHLVGLGLAERLESGKYDCPAGQPTTNLALGGLCLASFHVLQSDFDFRFLEARPLCGLINFKEAYSVVCDTYSLAGLEISKLL